VKLSSPIEQFEGQEIANAQIRAVGSIGVDLIGSISPSEETVPDTPRGIATYDDDIPMSRRPFALNAPKPLAEVEDEVVPLVADGLRYPDAQLHGRVDDRGLGYSTLLIGRELHALDRSRGLGWAVSV